VWIADLSDFEQSGITGEKMGKPSIQRPDIPAHWTDVQPPGGTAATGNPPWTVTDGGNAPAVLPDFNDTNDPNAVPPSDAELGFNAYGPGPWAAIFLHPLDAWAASRLADQAIGTTSKQFPQDTTLHNDAADAFRHAYWSDLMTKAFGPNEARQFGNSREIYDPNPSGERYMHLYNNQIGRNLAASGQGDPAGMVRAAVNRGTTRNSPFNRK
jgi:hypothetical protein